MQNVASLNETSMVLTYIYKKKKDNNSMIVKSIVGIELATS